MRRHFPPPAGYTFADLAVMPVERTWRHLRAMRHEPPGAAARGSRRDTFVSALEQAEQLFRAAAQVPYASRPILIFYGLSQAGRAIIAADQAKSLAQWQPTGHGIKAMSLDGPLHDILVSNQARQLNSSFLRLADVLDSPTLPRPVPLTEIWDTLPELSDWPIENGGNRRSTPLELQSMVSPAGENPAAVVRLIGLPPDMANSVDRRAAVIEFLRAYPTLDGYAFDDPPSNEPPRFEYYGDTRAILGTVLCWRVTTDSRGSHYLRQARIDRAATPYRASDGRLVIPAVGGNDRPLHPLIAWWAILFSLSMVARYKPAVWTRYIGVDTSRQAVPLEVALERALDACPELILYAIRDVVS